jgi:hypothetical protein
MKNLNANIKASLKYYQANLTDAATKAAQEDVKEARSRNLTLERNPRLVGLFKLEDAKLKKREHKEWTLSLPEIEGDFPINA